MSSSFRSSATLRSQVERGRPGGLLQFSAGCSNKRRHMSAESSIRATCPKMDMLLQQIAESYFLAQ